MKRLVMFLLLSLVTLSINAFAVPITYEFQWTPTTANPVPIPSDFFFTYDSLTHLFGDFVVAWGVHDFDFGSFMNTSLPSSDRDKSHPGAIDSGGESMVCLYG
jgi:hypothetical protein